MVLGEFELSDVDNFLEINSRIISSRVHNIVVGKSIETRSAKASYGQL